MFFIFFADDVERSTLRSDAHYFVDHAQDQARASDSEIRDPEVLQRAYLEYLDDDGSRFTLADGTPVLGSDLADWERNRWRVELNGNFDADVCLTIPTDVYADPVIQDDRCED